MHMARSHRSCLGLPCQARAYDFGICRIRPPASWNPPRTFHIRQQVTAPRPAKPTTPRSCGWTGVACAGRLGERRELACQFRHASTSAVSGYCEQSSRRARSCAGDAAECSAEGRSLPDDTRARARRCAPCGMPVRRARSQEERDEGAEGGAGGGTAEGGQGASEAGTSSCRYPFAPPFLS